MSSASGDNQNVDFVNAIFGSDLPFPEHSFKETPAIVEERSASSSSSKGGVVSFASPSTPRTFFVTRKEMVHEPISHQYWLAYDEPTIYEYGTDLGLAEETMAVPPPASMDTGSSEEPSEWDDTLSRGKTSRDECKLEGRSRVATRTAKKTATPGMVDCCSSQYEKTHTVVRTRVEDDNTEGDDERMSVSEGEEEDVGGADEDVDLDDEYLPEGYSEDPLTIIPDLSWLHDATKYDFYGAAAKLYKFPSEFELYFPEEDDVIIRPHDGCVGIYPYHFEFALRDLDKKCLGLGPRWIPTTTMPNAPPPSIEDETIASFAKSQHVAEDSGMKVDGNSVKNHQPSKSNSNSPLAGKVLHVLPTVRGGCTKRGGTIASSKNLQARSGKDSSTMEVENAENSIGVDNYPISADMAASSHHFKRKSPRTLADPAAPTLFRKFQLGFVLREMVGLSLQKWRFPPRVLFSSMTRFLFSRHVPGGLPLTLRPMSLLNLIIQIFGVILDD
ncbi:hypothetical protein BVRB_4g097420 [Beta vulgaris subsp. vulgaris]|uniref:Uncharacterized protein n=1 Tax=Beta vulgaris subsp. vulgaris TaxID=3555 RepID=A0A0J8BCX5_BETVV|nr:hypothetical protein BVRB_4g097420 [Beta vulgaris subsp. vulgaris]